MPDELADDPDLEEHESLLTRQALRISDQRVSEAFLRRLNRAVKAHVSGLAGTPRQGRVPAAPVPRKRSNFIPSRPRSLGPAM